MLIACQETKKLSSKPNESRDSKILLEMASCCLPLLSGKTGEQGWWWQPSSKMEFGLVRAYPFYSLCSLALQMRERWRWHLLTSFETKKIFVFCLPLLFSSLLVLRQQKGNLKRKKETREGENWRIESSFFFFLSFFFFWDRFYRSSFLQSFTLSLLPKATPGDTLSVKRIR